MPGRSEAPSNVGFVASAQGTFTPPVVFSWDFGDGRYSNGTAANISHEYLEAGSYGVRLSAVDLTGTRASNQTTYLVFPHLTTEAGLSPVFGEAPLLVTGNATVSGGVGPYHYNWTSARGVLSTGTTVSDLFQFPGLYSIQLVVDDALGYSANRSWNITVARSPTSALGVRIQLLGVTGGCSGSPQTLSLEAHELNGTPPLRYSWLFGDGDFSNLGPFVNHTYPGYGSYNISVTVNDSLGLSGSAASPTLDEPHPCVSSSQLSSVVLPVLLAVGVAFVVGASWVVWRRTKPPAP
jgi:PKD repeat protein